MALLLLSLGLGLVCAQDFNPRRIVQRNYDISKVSGTWYSISMAADNRKRIEEDGDLRIFIEGIQVVEDGGLKLSFHFMLHAECTDVAVVCGKTGKSGEYTINYLGENSLRILEADYQRYVILHMRNFRNGTATQVLALYGRFPELKSSFLDRFHKACRSHGLGPEKIIPFSNHAPRARGHITQSQLLVALLLLWGLARQSVSSEKQGPAGPSDEGLRGLGGGVPKVVNQPMRLSTPFL
ncbi:epididymal-specific lipocalin-9 [Bos mutus]|uniref:epididymal-specific lipocalin-9 n=1 Tax=Bos mutus TaxID=72004 RepID=UPI0038B50155